MKMNIFTIHEMYFTSFKYTFVRNTCIFDKDIFETCQIHLLYYEDINFHSYLLCIRGFPFGRSCWIILNTYSMNLQEKQEAVRLLLVSCTNYSFTLTQKRNADFSCKMVKKYGNPFTCQKTKMPYMLSLYSELGKFSTGNLSSLYQSVYSFQELLLEVLT